MYSSIYNYAKDHGLTPLRHRLERSPAAYLCIDSEGNYERLDIVPKKEREKRLFPNIGKNRAASGTNANMICNKKEYIFCIADDEGNYTGNTTKHQGWLEITEEGSAFSPTMNSIWLFCKRLEQDIPLYKEITLELDNAGIKASDFISFRVNGIRAEEAGDWEEWFDQRMDNLDNQNRGDAEEGISLLTGKPIIPIQGKEKFPQIMTSQTGTGSPIYSCSHKTVSGAACSFTSYGVINSLGSPMSIEQAEAIKAGLEFLLSSDKNHNDQFNIIYWYDKDESEDLIDLSIRGGFEDDDDDEFDSSKMKETAYSKLLMSAKNGTVPSPISDNGNYHIIQFTVPAKGRFYLSEEKSGKYEDLYNNIYYWYLDSSVTTQYWDSESKSFVEKRHFLTKLYGVLFGLLDHKGAKDKFQEIKNEYGQDRDKLLISIHENRQIPDSFYSKSLSQTVRVYRSGSSDDGRIIRQEANWPVPIQIIKVYLVRSGREEYRMDALNLENTSTAYNCGRMLAAVDRLQQISSENKVNLTIGQKYFKSASRTPGKIMTMALSNVENYLKKLKSNGTKVYFIHLFGEISESIGNSIPEKFNKVEQGEFMLGYFYQNNEFYKKKDKSSEENDNKGEE